MSASSVRSAVAGVSEPLSDRPLGELGLVDDVTVRGRKVRVAVTGLDDDLAYRAELERALRVAVAGEVEVRLSMAGPDRRQAVAVALRRTHRRPGALGSRTRLIAVASGKGGVGKSTVAANLAAALALDGARVGVVDADVWGYSQTTLFGVRQAPVAVPGLMFPVPAHGVRVMSVGFFVEEEEPLVWRGPMLQKALEQFLDDVYWGELDVLLVDLPPGTGDATLSVLGMLPDAAMVVVTTPQAAARTVAARVGRMARDARTPVLGVVETMAGDVFGAGGGERLAGDLGVPFLASVPLAAEVCAAGDAGVPLVLSAPEHPAAGTLRDLAARLPDARRSLVGRSLPLFVG